MRRRRRHAAAIEIHRTDVCPLRVRTAAIVRCSAPTQQSWIIYAAPNRGWCVWPRVSHRHRLICVAANIVTMIVPRRRCRCSSSTEQDNRGAERQGDGAHRRCSFKACRWRHNAAAQRLGRMLAIQSLRASRANLTTMQVAEIGERQVGANSPRGSRKRGVDL